MAAQEANDVLEYAANTRWLMINVCVNLRRIKRRWCLLQTWIRERGFQ